MNDWYFFVLLLVQGYFEGALNRDAATKVTRSRGGGSTCRWWRRLKKIACQLLSACSEACETGNEKGVGVWHAISGIVDNIDRSFLYGFYLYYIPSAPSSVARGYCSQWCLFVTLTGCLSVCQHNNSWTIRDIITKFSGHHVLSTLTSCSIYSEVTWTRVISRIRTDTSYSLQLFFIGW